jgi:hypothetical protein
MDRWTLINALRTAAVSYAQAANSFPTLREEMKEQHDMVIAYIGKLQSGVDKITG